MAKPKKPVLIVSLLMVAMLLIGMVLGGALTGAVVRHRLENLRAWNTPLGFTEYMEHNIIDLSPEQKEQLHPVFLRIGTDMSRRLRENRSIIRASMNELEKEMEQVLTPEQMEKWREKRMAVRERLAGRR